MKKTIISLMIALMAIALFSSCKKDDDSENSSVMSAQNVINSNSDIVTVKAMMWSEITDDLEIIATTSNFENYSLISTQKPSEEAIEWIFEDYKCCKSNQHQSLFQKHEHAKKF